MPAIGASPSLRTFRRASLDHVIADPPTGVGGGSPCLTAYTVQLLKKRGEATRSRLRPLIRRVWQFPQLRLQQIEIDRFGDELRSPVFIVSETLFPYCGN